MLAQSIQDAWNISRRLRMKVSIEPLHAVLLIADDGLLSLSRADCDASIARAQRTPTAFTDSIAEWDSIEL